RLRDSLPRESAAVVSADGEDRARPGVEPERGEDADGRRRGRVRLPRDALPAEAEPEQSEAALLYRWPATRAMQSVRQKVRDAVGYDDIYSLADKIRAVNPILRGWGQYFRIGNAHRHFKKVDSYVYTKLVNFLRRKHKRRGKGFRAFPPSFFRKAGLHQLHGTIVRRHRTQLGDLG